MSRETKFRAYSKTKNRYLGKGDMLIYRNEVGFDGSRWWASLVERQDHADEDIIVEQYTGLKDENGKEIYEGDIVRVLYGYNYEVRRFRTGAWRIGRDDLYVWADSSEVIGNIHENPELLGDGE